MEGLPVVVLLGGLPAALRFGATPGGASSDVGVTETMMRDGSVLAAVQSVVVVTVNFRRDMFGEYLAAGRSLMCRGGWVLQVYG